LALTEKLFEQNPRSFQLCDGVRISNLKMGEIHKILNTKDLALAFYKKSESQCALIIDRWADTAQYKDYLEDVRNKIKDWEG
jgi:hypothetical protein